jgi:hypothetical protein
MSRRSMSTNWLAWVTYASYVYFRLRGLKSAVSYFLYLQEPERMYQIWRGTGSVAGNSSAEMPGMKVKTAGAPTEAVPKERPHTE